MRTRYFLRVLNPLLWVGRDLSKKQNGSVKILIYHDIPENKLKQFYRQITWLKRRYSFIDPDSFHAFLDGDIDLSRRHILVTFDDGFASSHKAAEEVLTPLGVKALFFISSGFIDLAESGNWRGYVAQKIYDGKISEDRVSDYERSMTWEDVVSLKLQGHKIGDHTLNHSRLNSISNSKQLQREIHDARCRLEKKLGEEISDFAYPFGNVESISRESLSMIGKYYRYCYSGVRGENTSHTPFLSIRREAVSLDDPPGYVGFMIEDGLGWYYRNKRKKLDKLAISCTPKNL